MWDAAGSPSARTPPRVPFSSMPGQATPRLQQRHLVIQGWPFSWLRWQIRPLKRGGGQGCPSAPVFVHQLGLISSVLTVVHWFPLHVPHGFQTPSQNSSVPSPESSCLWTQAIFFPPFSFFSPPVFFPPGSFKQHSPGPAQRADPGWPCLGTHQVLQDDQDGHQHPPVVSCAGIFSDSSKPLCRTSPAYHLTGAAALPSDIFYRSESFLPQPACLHQSYHLWREISTAEHMEPVLASSLPTHRAGVAAARTLRVVRLPWGPSPLQLTEGFGQKKLDALGSGNVSLQIQGSGAEGTTLVRMRQKRPRVKKG